MNASFWKTRILTAAQAHAAGDVDPLALLYSELEVLSLPQVNRVMGDIMPPIAHATPTQPMLPPIMSRGENAG